MECSCLLCGPQLYGSGATSTCDSRVRFGFANCATKIRVTSLMYLLLNTTSTNVVTAIEERLKHEYKHSGEDRRRIASSDKIDIHIGSNGVPVSNGKDCLWIDDTEQQREHEREDAGYEDGMVVVAVHHRCTSKLAMPASRTEK